MPEKTVKALKSKSYMPHNKRMQADAAEPRR
jgi:hypothetical protein